MSNLPRKYSWWSRKANGLPDPASQLLRLLLIWLLMDILSLSGHTDTYFALNYLSTKPNTPNVTLTNEHIATFLSCTTLYPHAMQAHLLRVIPITTLYLLTIASTIHSKPITFSILLSYLNAYSSSPSHFSVFF